MDRNRLAKLTIQNKIETYIATGKYSSLEEFVSKHPDLKTFQQTAQLKTTMTAFGVNLTEEIYQDVLASMKPKQPQIEEQLTTSDVDGKEIVTYKSENTTIVVDDSYNNKPMIDQLADLQEKYSSFRDPNSAEEMMEYMRDDIKPEPVFSPIISIDKSLLNSQEQQAIQIAEALAQESTDSVQIDLDRNLLIHQGNIISVEEDEIAKQKTLKQPLLQQAGISSTVVLALLTGVFMGLTFLTLLR